MLPAGGLHVKHVVLAALCSAMAAVSTHGSPVVPAGPEPIRCAPCTPARLSQCPAVAPGCAEVLREPGCGCCLACALAAGEPCGIYTAPCGSGLRCSPRRGDPRPLHSLTRGQAECAPVEAAAASGVEENPEESSPEPQVRGKIRIGIPGVGKLWPGSPDPARSICEAGEPVAECSLGSSFKNSTPEKLNTCLK